jgi:hypothetical protein
MVEAFIPLVERFALLWHDGRIPDGEARVGFVARILELHCPDSDRLLTGVFSVEEWLAFREQSALHIATACDVLARSQGPRLTKGSHWTN